MSSKTLQAFFVLALIIPLAAAAQCSSGPCCDSNGNYRSSDYVCANLAPYYDCPQGTGLGSGIWINYPTQRCSGTSSACNGQTNNNWNTEVVHSCIGGHCQVGNNQCVYDPSCSDTGRKCYNSNTYGYKNSDCTWSNLQVCSTAGECFEGTCSSGYCNTNPKPKGTSCSGGTCDGNGNCKAAQVGCQYNNPACDSSHDCVNNQCVLKSGCTYNNPTCNANQDCINNQCVTKSGCSYSNPSCGAGYNCVNNTCVQDPCAGMVCNPIGECWGDGRCNGPSSCAYSAKAAGTSCSIGTCDGHGSCKQIGCAYNNPACSTGYFCSNNQCLDNCTKMTCNSPPGECYSAQGGCSAGKCSYPAKSNGTACSIGICDGKGNCNKPTGCQYNNPACTASQNCVNNKCVDKCTGVTCNAPPGDCYNSQGTCSAGSCSYSPKAAGTACSTGTCDGKGTCNAIPCSITSAAWSQSQAKGGDKVSMLLQTNSGCNGKTAEFTVWEDDGSVLLDDRIMKKNATVSNGAVSLQWEAAYLDDQWGDPEFYFEAKVDGQTKRSADIKVSQGTSVTFDDFTNAFAGQEVVIIKGTSLSQAASDEVSFLVSDIMAYTKKTVTVYTQGVNQNNCDLYYKLQGKTVIVIGTPADNSAYYCTPAPIEYSNSLIIKRNPWDYSKYAVWAKATNDDYDAITALERMFEYGVNQNLGLKDSLTLCWYAKDYPGQGTKIGCDMAPIAQLEADARSIWDDCYKERKKSWADIFLTYAAPIPFSACKFSLAITVYDAVTTPAYLTGVLVLPKSAGKTFLKALKGTAKEAAEEFIAKTSKEALAKSVETMEKLKVTGGPRAGEILATASRGSADKDVAVALYSVFSQGDEAAEPAIKYMYKNLGAGWTAKSIDGMGFLEKFGKEIPVDYSALSPGAATTTAEMFTGGELETIFKSTRKALGTEGGKIEMIFEDAIKNKDGVPDESVRAASRMLPDGTWEIRMRGKVPLELTKTEFINAVKKFSLVHELGHEKATLQMGEIGDFSSKLYKNEIEEPIANALVANKVDAAAKADFAANFKAVHPTSEPQKLVDQAIATDASKSALGKISAARASASKLGHSAYVSELDSQLKTQLQKRFDKQTADAMEKAVKDLSNDLVKYGDDIAAHPSWTEGTNELNTILTDVDGKLRKLELLRSGIMPLRVQVKIQPAVTNKITMVSPLLDWLGRRGPRIE